MAGAVLILSILGLHIPYFALTPGPAVDVTHLISVKGVKSRPIKGKLMLTTVSLLPSIRIGELVRGQVDPSIAIVSRSMIIQPGQSEQDVQQQTATQMRESQIAAAAAALRHLGHKVQITYSGIRVVGIQEASPASRALRPGDLITDVDGRPVRRPVDLVREIRKHKVGSNVRLRVVRGAKPFTAVVGTIGRATNKKDPVIGVVIDALPQVKLPFPVSIDAQGIGGPSAGLMFALGVVDLVGASDLTKGRRIAGTGEIAFDGRVGPVGGIRQKLEGARRAGAQLFIAPLDELGAACAAANGMSVVGVANLKDAVGALEGVRQPPARRCS